MNGRGTWTGPLTDCAGRPTPEAVAALAALAAPVRVDSLDDLTPWVRAVRRIAPAAGWALAETAPTRAPRDRRRESAARECPPGQERATHTADAAPPSRPERGVTHGAASGASNRGAHAQGTRGTRPDTHRTPARPPQPRCVAIAVARDPHTHDAVLTLGDGTNIRALHPRLLTMLSTLAQRFAGHRVEIVSGYRPSTNPHHGSRHAHARAIDFRFAGISRENLRDAARALPDAGVGYYPNSVFVHLDVRDASEGPARWTDYSGHGETPRYGHWPPRDEDVVRELTHLRERARDALAALSAREMAAPSAGDEAAREEQPAATPSSTVPPSRDDDARAEEEATREDDSTH